MKMWKSVSVLALAVAAAAEANPGTAFVGVDGQVKVSTNPSNMYYNLDNPNHNRLTFLHAHWGSASPHYHSIGRYAYEGTPPAHTITTANALYPELTYHGDPVPRLQLRPGSGIYAGKLTSGTHPGDAWSNLHMQSTALLGTYAPATPEQIMFNSSGNRWSGSLVGSTVALELVALSPGLHVGNASTMNLMSVGDQIVLGPGDNLSFTPVLWIDDEPDAPMRQASFKLVDVRDTGTPFGESGVFNIQVIPEPAALTLLPLAGLALLRRRWVEARN